jgi:hypothetical protein
MAGTSVNLGSFPSKETALYTRLTFYKYSRATPNVQAQINAVGYMRLPLPMELSESYNAKIGSTDLDLAGTFFGGNVDAKGVIDSFINSRRDSTGIWNNLSKAGMAAAALSPTTSDTSIGRLAQTSLGLVRNPHTTTIFEGVNLRTHNLSFKISPQSQTEAIQIRNMIQEIKLRMHPELAGGSFALTYPEIVTVKFQGLDPLTAPMIRRSFISTFTPNYSASGFSAFFNNPEGASPIDMMLSLQLQELDIVTKETIQDPDFYGASEARNELQRDFTLQSLSDGFAPGGGA